MADRRGIIVPLLIIGFIFFSSNNPPTAQFGSGATIQDAVAGERRSLSVLQNSTYGDISRNDEGFLNLTGLELERGYAWSALPAVKERARQHLEYALGDAGESALDGDSFATLPALYHNVTGYVQGKWVRSKLQESVATPRLNMSAYAAEGPFGLLQSRSFERNITGADGDVRMRFRERTTYDDIALANITGISAEMTFTDDSTGEETELQMYGVYQIQLGQVVMTTTSEKFAGVFILPHFALSQHSFGTMKTYMNQSISRTIRAQENGDIERLNPWPSQTDGTPPTALGGPQCELVMYLQQMPPSGGELEPMTGSTLAFIEQEARYPTGAIVPSLSNMRFTMLAFSPDCGYVLESRGPPDFAAQEAQHLAGLKAEMLYKIGRHHVLLFALTIGGQIALLMRQMREANTPSTRSRISFSTIAMLALGDGFATMTFLLISLFVHGLWVDLVGTAFLAFTSVSFFGMRFLADLWVAQAPERAQHQQADATRTQSTPSLPGSLPLPVTAERPTDTGATPVFMPSDQEGLEPVTEPVGTAQPGAQVGPRTSSFGALYLRFYLLLLATLFMSLNATTWPSPLRRGFFTLLATVYLSFWVPQILRNVQRNCRHALEWRFVVGQSVLRLVPFAYFYAYKHNVLFAKPDYYSLGFLVIWIWVQVLVLASQELVGPRWFVGKDWAPPAYDYHPILREDEEGATMPIGLSETSAGSAPTTPLLERRTSLSSSTARRGSTAKDTKAKGKRVFDCAICFQELEVPVIEAGGSGDSSLGAGLLARRSYMVTPCRHIFHSACLEGWMKYRLQCPICRETLPPL
ncbi:hypothetical protein BAUCODRAFT_105318 [Baudoinia panamericana UAMH 10762]|uniref:DSC E3 ubiquitin ligase complex subunit A n=1 Tax=Baudoinia panamericana (strain UAMH 10762) TaxID=717646 RepID=M2NFZ1_BAUPA|nr:uncharacterized protein BAUCODRAFT_105318 [Baudoinia panamericana UAMH 10762]EMC98199.1 hypothetical protein BAUCODRAFT_105318 [Baudoinia panamericana UAMH 10762]